MVARGRFRVLTEEQAKEGDGVVDDLAVRQIIRCFDVCTIEDESGLFDVLSDVRLHEKQKWIEFKRYNDNNDIGVRMAKVQGKLTEIARELAEARRIIEVQRLKLYELEKAQLRKGGKVEYVGRKDSKGR
jgi:hypothetical protein